MLSRILFTVTLSVRPLTAYGTLFVWSFLAATIVPVGSEPALFALVIRGYPVWPSVAVATTGNVLGACTTYWLARSGAALVERRANIPLDSFRAFRLVQAYGEPALLLSWVPLIGDALVAVAGAVRMPIVPFVVWMTIGKAARYVAVAWGAAAFNN